jgi:hypothetical protein
VSVVTKYIMRFSTVYSADLLVQSEGRSEPSTGTKAMTMNFPLSTGHPGL